MPWTYTLLYQCLTDLTRMRRNHIFLRVRLFINWHCIVICSSKDAAYLFKLAHEWAKKNPYLDFTIRFVYILTHISWSFYLKDVHSICAFVAMTWFNLFLSLYIYLVIKVVVSLIVCSLGSWLILWVILFNCLYDSCGSSEEDNATERDQESNNRQNLHQYQRRR